MTLGQKEDSTKKLVKSSFDSNRTSIMLPGPQGNAWPEWLLLPPSPQM